MNCEVFRETILSPALRAVAAHWHQARGTKLMPCWSDLRPAKMARQLSIIWVYKYDPRTKQFTGRLAGNRITEGFGKSFRGVRLEDIHPPQYLPRIYQHMLRVVETPAVYKCGGTLFRKGGVCGMGERIMLPLGGSGVDGLLGASDYELAPDTGKGEAIQLLGEGIRWFPVIPQTRPYPAADA